MNFIVILVMLLNFFCNIKSAEIAQYPVIVHIQGENNEPRVKNIDLQLQFFFDKNLTLDEALDKVIAHEDINKLADQHNSVLWLEIILPVDVTSDTRIKELQDYRKSHKKYFKVRLTLK